MFLYADVPLREDSNGITNYKTSTDVTASILKIF